MKTPSVINLSSVVMVASSLVSSAVTILPAAINQGGTVSSTSFDIDSGLTTATVTTDPGQTDVTFSASVGGVATNFSNIAGRLGLPSPSPGSNGAFNDPTADPNNADTQTLTISFSNAGLGLGGLTYDFSRADSGGGLGFGQSAGGGGIFISGFLFDPRLAIPEAGNDPTGLLTGSVTNRDDATATGGDLNPTEVYYSAGTLEIDQSAFGNPDVIITLNPAASFGQTLVFTPADPDQAGAQFAPTSFEIVPEPSLALLSGLGVIGLLRRQRS